MQQTADGERNKAYEEAQSDILIKKLEDKRISLTVKDILEGKGISTVELYSILKEINHIQLGMESHGINYEISTIQIKEGLDLAHFKILLKSTQHLPESLIKAPLDATIAIGQGLLRGKIRVDKDDNISFSIISIEKSDLLKSRKHRRITLLSKENIVNLKEISSNHLSLVAICINSRINGLLHDLSFGGAGIFIESTIDKIKTIAAGENSEFSSIQNEIEIINARKSILLKFNIVNIAPFNDNGIIRIGGEFINVNEKTENEIYSIMIEAERKALQKIKQNSIKL